MIQRLWQGLGIAVVLLGTQVVVPAQAAMQFCNRTEMRR